MEKLVFAQYNNRELSFADKIFGIAGKAGEAAAKVGKENIIDATIGALIDDNGELIVFESVVEGLHQLKPADYSAYAPISGLPAYLDVAQKYAFGNHRPNMYTAACATPGGSGAIRTFISNYTNYGDAVITSDWYWAAYKTICTEIGRSLDTYNLIDENGKYNIASFEAKVAELIAKQECLGIIINTPAHNPTGFSLTDEDWDKVIEVVNKYAVDGKKITIFVDAAYIDYTPDPDAARVFLEKFVNIKDSVLITMGYSASKGFTLYGMRCGALICMTNVEEICTEFKNVCNFSCRGTWSNGTRAAQQLLVNMYEDKEMKAKVDAERNANNEVLVRRGKVFEQAAKECGLEMVPFDAGFFASMPCKDPDAVVELLFQDNVFIVPLAMGLRVALSAVTEEQCKILPGIIKKRLDEFYGK